MVMMFHLLGFFIVYSNPKLVMNKVHIVRIQENQKVIHEYQKVTKASVHL